MDATSILGKDEVLLVLKDLKRRAKRSANSRLNLIIFRLSCCCGLRCCEITGLQVGDVSIVEKSSRIRIRKENTKGEKRKRKGRLVPLYWDADTTADIANWLEYCKQIGRKPTDTFIFGQNPKTFGKPLLRRMVQKRWQSAIRPLGPDRVRQLSIHKGRHTFASHSLHVGHSLTAVKEALGHSNLVTTSIYAHMVEESGVRDLFTPEPKPPNKKVA